MRSSSRNVFATVAAGGLIAALNAAPGFVASDQPDTEPADASVQSLQDDLDQILADERLDGAQASVVVHDGETGEELYNHTADTRLMPASNNKLLTSASALDILGPDYTFDTTVASGADGNLYIHGGGDPTMLAADYADLAEQVAAAGVTSVEGDLVADDSFFDAVRLGLDWAWDDEPWYYAAPVSALTVSPNTDYDAGTVIVGVDPDNKVGSPATATVTPATDAVDIVVEATTGAKGSDTSLNVERGHGTNTIVVSGTIARGEKGYIDWASVWDPTAYAADVFKKALEAEGVTVQGDVVTGMLPEGAETVAEHSSMPISEMMTPFMKLSNNGHAEVLAKTIGREIAGEGSWDAGLDAITEQLKTYGVNTDTISTRDGSGLSRRNLIPSAEIMELLEAVQGKPWFDVWYESLPIAGESDRFVGGTLRSRMVGTAAEGNAHAKTGSLTGATGLSGYVNDADGDRLIFSILMNDYLSSKPSDIEDKIVVRLAEYTESAGASTTLRSDVPTVNLPSDVECSWVKTAAGDAC